MDRLDLTAQRLILTVRESWPRLAVAAFLALLLALMLPTLHAGVVYQLDLEIIATGAKNPASQGSEVWVKKFTLGDEARPSELFDPGADWEPRDDLLVSYRHQPARLSWHGWVPRDTRLEFGKHAWSGVVEVRINGVSRNYDLYAQTGGVETIGLEQIVTGRGKMSVSVQWFLLCLVGASAAFYWLLGRFAPRPGVFEPMLPPTAGRTWPWWVFGVPTLVASLIFHIGFWPAQMSNDSLDQWNQVLTGVYSNHHPVAHTFFLTVVSALWPSPAIVILVQIAALSLVVALFIDEARAWGVHERVCRVVALALPVVVVNQLMVTVMWKDVPFAIGLAYSLVAILSFLRLGPAQARNPGWLAGVIAAGVAVTLFRHNGLVVGPLVPLALAVLGWKTPWARWRLLAIGVGLILSYVGVNKVLVPALGIPNVSIAAQIPQELHVLGGMIAADVSLDEQDRETIATIYPPDQWKSQYVCDSFLYVFWQPNFNMRFVNDNADKIHSLVARLIVAHPGIFLRHQLCASSLVWRIIPFVGEAKGDVPAGIADIPLREKANIVFDPPLTALNAAVTELYRWSITNLGLMWRPGLFMYLVIVASVILAYATRNWRLLVLAVPTLANNLPYLWLMCSPDYRYLFGGVLSGELLPVLLFALSSLPARVLAPSLPPEQAIAGQPAAAALVRK